MVCALRGLATRFIRNSAGGGLVIFALALPALLGVAGGAVDYASVSQSRARLQAAADAAALAIAREMTIALVTPSRVSELATAHVNAYLEGLSTASVEGKLAENGLAVEVRANQPLVAPLGILALMSGQSQIEARALARVSAASMQTKLCMLALDEKRNGGLFMHNGSAITAPECVMHSNSGDRNSVIVQNGSKILASLICARGGIANMAGQVQAQMLSDCPKLIDPLAGKPEPSVEGACTATDLEIGVQKVGQPARSGGSVQLTAPSIQRTLSPGVYCGGIFIDGNARVTLSPGVYVMRDGPLVVAGNAELVGQGVTIMFAGTKAYFRFLDNSLIQLSAPTGGLSAGMLLWESRRFVLTDASWQRKNCDRDDDDDAGDEQRIKGNGNAFGQNQPPNCQPGGNVLRRPGEVPIKKTNEHHINSDRARELTGTIYLLNGLLLIDSRRPVADQSPFTVLVASKVDLFDGPNLMLNANYNGSPVPVPQGLGAIGAKNVRLGK